MMRVLIIFVVLMTLPTVGFADTIHVPADQPTIQAGINAAVNGDTVFVAPGTYPENIDFAGKAITMASQQGPEHTYIDGRQIGSVVIFDQGEGLGSVLEGFTLLNGDASRGGGIYCGAGASPTVIDNVVTNNYSDGGGGMYNDQGSAPTVINCIFNENEAYILSAGYTEYHGGGMYNHNSDAIVIGCTFTGNISNFGGGMYNYLGSPTITNCSFIKNRAREWSMSWASHSGGEGAGIYNSRCDGVKVTNCLFNQNVADKESFYGTDGKGGGAYNYSCPTEFMNCTFCNNIAEAFTGLILGGGIYNIGDANTKVTNCVLWGDVPNEIYNSMLVTITVTSSCVEGGYSGTGNIDADPLFADDADDDIHLSWQSPCRDTGDDSVITELFDFEGDPRIAWNGTVDMGADEFYTHLYYTGDATPGGDIQGKLVGIPGTWPVGLFFGSGVRETPWHHMWGDFWLEEPWFVVPLNPIPANGVLVMPTTLSFDPPAPWDLPMQGLVGLDPDSFTNLCVLEVR
ncbi:MAG: right-handed parallel beta-helix repeat-containing protein [Planctomycetes bacterium]|nr:right-handed parallel beta-helix repeat-containing protein [Planctomycetota bacterium]